MRLLKRASLFLLLTTLVTTSVFWYAKTAYGVTRTWDGGGRDANWNNALNWSDNTVPTASDVARFDGTCVSNCSPTINVSISVQGIDMQADYAGTITQSGGVTITVGTAGWVQAGGVFVGGNNFIDINTGIFSLSGGTFVSTTGTLILDSAAGAGNLTFFQITGGTFDHASGTVDFSPSGSGAQYFADVDTALDLYNVVFSSDGNDNTSIAVGDTIVAHNNFTYTIGQLASGGTLEVKNNISMASTVDGGSMLVKMTGTGDQTITGSGGSAHPFNLEVDKSSGTTTVSGNVLLRSLTLTAGDAFVSTSNTLTLSHDFLNVTGVPFLHNNGTVIFEDNLASPSINVATSETFFNLTKTGGGSVHIISAGDTLIVEGTFRNIDGVLNGGTVDLYGDVILSAGGDGGSTVLRFVSDDDQNFTGDTTENAGGFPTVINKSSGTVYAFQNIQINNFTIQSGIFVSTTGILRIDGNWIHTAGGSFEHNGGTVIFDILGSIDVMTIETFYNLTKTNTGDTHTIASGDTLQILGTFTLNSGSLNGGTIQVNGDVIINTTAGGSSVLMHFMGTSTQYYTDQGGNEPNGDITINKPSGSVILNSNADWNDAGQDLTITSGTLVQSSSYSLSTGAVTVGTAGKWLATGTGTTTLGGNVTNNGLIDFRGNNTCGGPDALVLQSSVNGTQRSWSGSGKVVMYDVRIRDQGGTLPITAYSCTSVSNNAANWTFSTAQCPFLNPVLQIKGGEMRINSGQVRVQ